MTRSHLMQHIWTLDQKATRDRCQEKQMQVDIDWPHKNLQYYQQAQALPSWYETLPHSFLAVFPRLWCQAWVCSSPWASVSWHDQGSGDYYPHLCCLPELLWGWKGWIHMKTLCQLQRNITHILFSRAILSPKERQAITGLMYHFKADLPSEHCCHFSFTPPPTCSPYHKGINWLKSVSSVR